jgi:hypothetical protein
LSAGEDSISVLLHEGEELTEAINKLLPSNPNSNDVDSSNTGKRKRGRPPKDKNVQTSSSGHKHKEVKRIPPALKDEDDPTTCGK